ncbi:MAG: methylmalonyl-CoA epimerase [Anaerolineales bacterium]|nr:methylmalonyl-CoA epimerase [Anaerolineales bacterium]
MSVLKIDHIAIVIPEIQDALNFWQQALELPLEHTEEIPEQETVLAMLPVGEAEIELVQPTTETSGMAKYMEKKGPGLHHVCFEVDDLDAALARLKEKGIRLINEEPVIGAGGRRVAFVHPKSASGVLVELVESPNVI